MAKTLQHRRNTTAGLSGVTGSVGEIFIDTTKNTVVVMDGSTAGGYPLELEGAGTGATGPTGATGVTGASGTQGVNGASGSNGTNGATGTAGVDGATGVAGVNGATGSQGIQGASGSTGLTGATGIAGATGAAGSNGTNGATGAAGATGVAGSNGSNGATGATGTAGSNGATGPQGASGPQSGYLNGPITGFSLLIGATGVLTAGATGNGWFGGALYVGPQGATGVAWGATGEIRATAEVTAYYSSDERLKENILPIDNALGKLRQLKGVMFDWKDDVVAGKGGEDGYFVRKHDTGVIAQEVEAVLPEVVAERADGFKAVRYEKLAGLIIQAINELADQVDALKK